MLNEVEVCRRELLQPTAEIADDGYRFQEYFRQDDRRVAETGALFQDVEEYERNGEKRYVQVMKSPVAKVAVLFVGGSRAGAGCSDSPAYFIGEATPVRRLRDLESLI